MNGKTYQKVIDFQTLGRIFPKEKSLEQKVSGTTAFIALFGGVFFFSTKITANVVGVSPQASSLIGAGLLTVGLIAGFFWVRKSKGL